MVDIIENLDIMEQNLKETSKAHLTDKKMKLFIYMISAVLVWMVSWYCSQKFGVSFGVHYSSPVMEGYKVVMLESAPRTKNYLITLASSSGEVFLNGDCAMIYVDSQEMGGCRVTKDGNLFKVSVYLATGQRIAEFECSIVNHSQNWERTGVGLGL